MAYERYPRGTQPGDYYNRSDDMDYGRDYGSGRDYTYSSARDYEAAGRIGGDRDAGREDYGRGNRGYYGGRQAGQRQGGYDRGYGAQMNRGNQMRDYGSRGYGDRDYSNGGYGDRNRGMRDTGMRDTGTSEYHGSYAHDGRRFEDVGRYAHADDDNYRDRGMNASRNRDYGRQPEGYDYEERGFFDRAGDEVRSWFGDDEAERRREMDARHDARHYGDRYASHRDADYHSWRRGQIDALDRDYDEYRRENQTKFHNEFSSWRSNRQGQRDALNKVEEHAEVVGSDGEHVGTVDKVRGDRILLTKNDKDAGGIHHSIPSSWIKEANDKKVTLTKSASDAKQSWRDEERNQAMFGYGDNVKDATKSASGTAATTTGTTDTENRTLNKGFSGTY